VNAQGKGKGPYEGKGKSYHEACDDAHGKAAREGHSEDDWLVVEQVLVRGHNPIIEYLVRMAPHG
jgi:hypothetical protein